MNQSEVEANACNRRQARETVRKQVTIRFGFTSDWLKKMARVSFNQSQSLVKQNQSTCRLFSILN